MQSRREFAAIVSWTVVCGLCVSGPNWGFLSFLWPWVALLVGAQIYSWLSPLPTEQKVKE